jgi:hypothetical protein
MMTAPANMQIVINLLLRSLCITKGSLLVETASPTDKQRIYFIGRMGTSEPVRRARRERPRGCRAAEQRDERAASCMTGKEHCER